MLSCRRRIFHREKHGKYSAQAFFERQVSSWFVGFVCKMAIHTPTFFYTRVLREPAYLFSTPGVNAPNTVCRYCKQEKPRLEDLTRTSEELQALSYKYDQRLIGKTQRIRVRLSHIFVWGQHMAGGKYRFPGMQGRRGEPALIGTRVRHMAIAHAIL